MGAVIGRAYTHKSGNYRGYIGMLAVDKEFRRRFKIGTELVQRQIDAMKNIGVAEVNSLTPFCSFRLYLKPRLATLQLLSFTESSVLFVINSFPVITSMDQMHSDSSFGLNRNGGT